MCRHGEWEVGLELDRDRDMVLGRIAAGEGEMTMDHDAPPIVIAFA